MQKILSINIIALTVVLMVVGIVTDHKPRKAKSSEATTTFEVSRDGYVSWVKIPPSDRYHVIVSGDKMDIRPQ